MCTIKAESNCELPLIDAFDRRQVVLDTSHKCNFLVNITYSYKSTRAGHHNFQRIDRSVTCLFHKLPLLETTDTSRYILLLVVAIYL